MMRLWASNEDPYPGETITLCVTLDWLPLGQTTITVVNPVTQEQTAHVVDLDQNGHGCTTWTVPQGWATALVKNEHSDDLGIIVTT